MDRLVCHYFDGSPFARMVRVLARELAMPMEEIVVADFPPDPGLFKLNPLGQVPVLMVGTEARFPTDIALAALGDGAAAGAAVPAPLRLSGFDLARRQLLSVILALGDQIVARRYRMWAGLVQANPDRLGFDMNLRALERINATLDWLEPQITAKGFDPEGISLQDIALTCLLLWTDSRGPIPWRGRRNVEDLVDSLSQRPSFVATVPRPYAH